ncbi:hypothetical protein OSB04_007500 [Centaurea solstitialis]|uniref:Uncharacterized protein n=1 Tax=Centaurea solstitialis TaxID=347529 RepID=A0AA38WQW8_9ASTR|nr:hypothetical protein OSB04_007500 [Centaurea solstitialis]
MAGKISTDFDPSEELAAMKNKQVRFERKIEELIKSVHALQVGCEECKGPHLTKDCPNKPMMTPEEVNFLNRGDYQGRWNNNRNFNQRPPDFFAPNQQNQRTDGEPRMSLEDRLFQFMESQKKLNQEVSSYLRNQQSVIQNLELQVGRISQALSGRTQGELPTQTKVNPKKYIPSDSESEPDYAIDYDSDGITISFEHLLLRDPIYLSDEEEEDSKQGGYAEFMIPKQNKGKEKAKDEDAELTYVSPIKYDLGSYSLPFSVSNKFKGLALIDSGAALNMMHVSYCSKMKIKKLTPTAYQYHGINGYMTTPLGIAEAVPIRIGNFVYLMDFIVADLPKDTEIPIIFGRAFLHTAQVNLDMHNQFGTSEVKNEEIRPKTKKVKNGNRQISLSRTFKFRDAESVVLGTSRRELSFPDAKFQFLVLQFFDSMASKRTRSTSTSASAPNMNYRAPNGTHAFTYFMNDSTLSAAKQAEYRDIMDRIKSSQIFVPRRPDWTLLQTLEIDGDVKAVFEKHAIGENGLEYYICKAWDRVFNINETLYRELILEFVATYTFNPIKATEDCREKCINFRFGRIWWTLSSAEFGVALGIYTQAEVNDPGFKEYMVATSKTPEGFNPRETWDIFGSGNFSSNIKVKGLLSPLDQLLHRSWFTR